MELVRRLQAFKGLPYDERSTANVY